MYSMRHGAHSRSIDLHSRLPHELAPLKFKAPEHEPIET
jgi:hypothetical protein